MRISLSAYATVVRGDQTRKQQQQKKKQSVWTGGTSRARPAKQGATFLRLLMSTAIQVVRYQIRWQCFTAFTRWAGINSFGIGKPSKLSHHGQMHRPWGTHKYLTDSLEGQQKTQRSTTTKNDAALFFFWQILSRDKCDRYDVQYFVRDSATGLQLWQHTTTSTPHTRAMSALHFTRQLSHLFSPVYAIQLSPTLTCQ